MQSPDSHAHEAHAGHFNPWLLGAIGTVGAISLAAYALPLMGLGRADDANNIMHFLGGDAAIPNNFGSAIAGGFQGILSHVPVLGNALTSTTMITIPGLGIGIGSGALFALGLTATIGIGGMLLANWMEKNEDPNAKIHWSKIVRTVALATSMLIALPSIIGGLAVGITFLAGLFSVPAYNATIEAMKLTLGAPSMAMGSMAGPATSLTAILPHLLTCGLPFIPLAAAFLMGKKSPSKTGATQTQIELVSPKPMRNGEPNMLCFRLRDANGRLLGPDDIETTHTEKIHCMVVDQSLTDYHHVHPQFDSATGLFTAYITPRMNSRYMAWNEFTPQGANEPMRQRVDLPSEGAPSLPPGLMPNSTASVGGLIVKFASEQPLQVGNASLVHMQVTDGMGRPINHLEPIMGAHGHLAGFSADARHFIHCHPLTGMEEPIVNGELAFHITPEQAGINKFFLQLRHNGQDLTFPFAQPVRAPVRYTQQTASPAQQHHHAIA